MLTRRQQEGAWATCGELRVLAAHEPSGTLARRAVEVTETGRGRAAGLTPGSF